MNRPKISTRLANPDRDRQHQVPDAAQLAKAYAQALVHTVTVFKLGNAGHESTGEPAGMRRLA